MTNPNVPQTSLPRVRTTFADWGLAYKVALGDVAFGVLVLVLSPFVGGVFYTLAIEPLISRVDVPEGWRADPQSGTTLLALLGFYLLAAGICIFGVRLVLELLGLAGAPALTRRMRPRGKLALGAAAAGTVVYAAGTLPAILLDELFTHGEFPVPWIASALDATSQAGGLLVLCALITLFLGGGRRGALLRWTDAVGWGKMRWGWINKLALALIAGGLVSMFPFFWTPWMPFDDVSDIFASTGVILLVLGIVPQFLASRGP